MSSAVTAVPSVAPAKSPKKKRARSAGKKPGLTVSDLIIKAISNERGSVSLAALKKALKAGGYDVVKNKTRILTAVKRLVLKKSLVQTKGTGASGSFKLNKKPPTPKKKKVVKKKKPKAKRVKRTSVKKAAGGASPAAKKSPKKKRKSKAKSPKKAKRPAAAKKTKKAKSPKKAKRRVSKSTTRISTRAAAKK